MTLSTDARNTYRSLSDLKLPMCKVNPKMVHFLSRVGRPWMSRWCGFAFSKTYGRFLEVVRHHQLFVFCDLVRSVRDLDI